MWSDVSDIKRPLLYCTHSGKGGGGIWETLGGKIWSITVVEWDGTPVGLLINGIKPCSKSLFTYVSKNRTIILQEFQIQVSVKNTFGSADIAQNFSVMDHKFSKFDPGLL